MIERLLDMYYSFSETGKPVLGDYALPQFDSNNPNELKFAHIRGPNDMKTETSSNYGDEEFWLSLGFDEN